MSGSALCGSVEHGQSGSDAGFCGSEKSGQQLHI